MAGRTSDASFNLDTSMSAIHAAVDDPDAALRLAMKAERTLKDANKMCPSTLQTAIDSLAALCVWKADSTAGFPGAVLLVRPPEPGTEWLGGHATPSIQDDPLFYAALPASSSPAILPGSIPLSLPAPHTTPGASALTKAPPPPDLLSLAHSQHRPRGYRCLADAVSAAADGDTIVLLEGTHPSGSGREEEGGIRVDKRLLIKGRGRVTLEHRANAPLLRLLRGAVVQDLTIDMVGFRECVRCEGAGSPLLLRVVLSSSGGDALHVTGGARPLLVDCSITAKQTGVRVWSPDTTRYSSAQRTYGSPLRPAAMLHTCSISDCGSATCAATGCSAVVLEGCTVRNAGEEGVLLSGSAQAQLTQVTIKGCRGPAVDASGSSQVVLQRCSFDSCGGGLWLWGSAHASVHGPGKIESATGPALVVEQHATTAPGDGKRRTSRLGNSPARALSLACGSGIRAHGVDASGADATAKAHDWGRADQAAWLLWRLEDRHQCPSCCGKGGIDVASELVSVRVAGQVLGLADH